MLDKNAKPHQPIEQRIKNFYEVSLGFDDAQAKQEAARCLHCASPRCVKGCPVNVPIPSFIAKIKENDLDTAYEIITGANSLPSICGRVCQQERQCEGHCVLRLKGRPVTIGNLERFAADRYNARHPLKIDFTPITQKHKVAVIGCGPAGVTCASDLNKMGYDVTVFEAMAHGGGVLYYGIPDFRLPREVVNREINNLAARGVKIIYDCVIGKDISVEDIFEQGFSAVFVGTGADSPQTMNIEGEELKGIYTATDYLARVNVMGMHEPSPLFVGRRVAVIGGGNVAMDAARCALRLGSEVKILYRRSIEELPACMEEINAAAEEGVDFQWLTAPVRFLGKDGVICGVECVKMRLGEPDDSGRKKPEPVPGSNFILDVDSAIVAIGSRPSPMVRVLKKELTLDKYGCIVADERCSTGIDGIYAGGDIVNGPATVILAMGNGKTAAKSIHEYLQNKE